jgi:hypothetical protein
VSRLVLRRGTVASVELHGPEAELTVEVDGERRRAIAYTGLTGPVEPGDDVLVNAAGVELGLGSGGFDIVHANLTRGLDAAGERGAHVMKLNYTPLQHAVHPVEELAPELDALPLEKPAAVIALHGQLPCVAWAARDAGRIGYVQTPGGALPGAHSRVVAQMVESGLLAGHITAGSSFGGDYEALSVPGALHAGLTELGWDAAIAGPGPGILGSATALGHGGLAALDTAHAALALGCPTIVVPRMSEGDARERHRGLSHHTETVLRLLLRPVVVALPEGFSLEGTGEHQVRPALVDLDSYGVSGLPTRTMGRAIEDDELFFRAALAGGAVLAEEIDGI